MVIEIYVSVQLIIITYVVSMVPCASSWHYILFHEEDARSNNPQCKDDTFYRTLHEDIIAKYLYFLWLLESN